TRGSRSHARTSAANLKVGPPGGAGVAPGHGDIAHAGSAGSAVGPGDQDVEDVAIPRDLGLDAAILAVPAPAHDAEPARLALHRPAIPHALHAAADHEMRDCHQARTSLRKASSSSVAMPSLFAFASFEPGSSPTTT